MVFQVVNLENDVGRVVAFGIREMVPRETILCAEGQRQAPTRQQQHTFQRTTGIGINHRLYMDIDLCQKLVDDCHSIRGGQLVQPRKRNPGIKADGLFEPALGARRVRTRIDQTGQKQQPKFFAALHLQAHIGIIG